MPLKKLLFIICLVYWCVPSAARDTLVISSVKEPILISKYLGILKDPRGQLSFTGVVHTTDESFLPVTTRVPVFAGTDSYVWVKLVLVNTAGRNLWLWVNNAATDSVFYYETTATATRLKLSGDKVRFGNRDLKSNRILFQVSNTPTPVTIYLRLNIRLPRQFPLYIISADAFAESGSTDFFVDGLFYGLVGVIVLYNLFLWFTLREKFYLYYIGYILFSGLLLLHFDGITYAYLWPGHPSFNDHPAILSSIPMLFALLFVASFLNLKKYSPVLLKGLWILGIIWIGCMAVSLAGWKFAALTISQVTAFAGAFYFLIPGVVVYTKGYTPARYYVAAWSFLIVGVMVFLAKDMGWIPYNAITAHTLKTGIAAEAVMMAFALADRINFFKNEQQRLAHEKEAETEQRKKAEHHLKNAAELLEGYTENLKQKNALIEQFRHDMEQLELKLKGAEPGKEYPEYISRLMQSIILTEDDWKEFRQLYDKAHPGYIYRLKQKYTGLTENDIRLLTLVKLRLSVPEMANMLGVSVDAIRKSRQRLRKKVNLGSEEKLEDLVSGI